MNSVKFTEDAHGMRVLKISNNSADALVYLHGGHVASFKPKGSADLLWMSKMSMFENGKPIRGGIPICWPWFGAPDKAALPNARTSHGLIRLVDWDIEEVSACGSSTQVVLSVSDSPETITIWPFKFKLSLSVTVSDALSLLLTTENTGSVPFTVTQAMHTYFDVGDIARTTVSGFDGVPFIDTVPGTKKPHQIQSGDIAFTEETDRIYTGFSGDAVINDTANRRKIKIHKENSSTSVVWNPWINKSAAMPDFGDDEYKGMLCVETCNIQEDCRNVAPGGKTSLGTIISVEHE